MQAKRKVAGCRLIAFEHEIRVDGAQREAERIRIGDLKPDANARAAEWRSGARAEESQFGGLARRLFKPRRANDLLQAAEAARARGARGDGSNEKRERDSSTAVSRHGAAQRSIGHAAPLGRLKPAPAYTSPLRSLV